MSDGDWVFDGPGGMHVNRICEDLIRRGEIQPIIVVAISRVSDAQRSFDLSPWPDYRFELPTGGGDNYVRAVRDTLKKEVDRAYRTLPDRRNTAIGGMSRGGLLAVYAGYAYDSTFGKVAAFSPNYTVGIPDIYDFASQRGKPPLLERLYQDTGYPDDISIERMARLAVQQGFVMGRDFASFTIEGAEHSTAAWEHRFPNALRFLFGR